MILYMYMDKSVVYVIRFTNPDSYSKITLTIIDDIPGLRREFKTKPTSINNSTTVIVRRTFISYVFSTLPPPISIHFWQRSYHRRKAVANSSAPILLVTPSHSFLRVLWSKETPASSVFTRRNKKKSASARSGE